MSHSNDIIQKITQYGANNYNPLPIVIERGEGVWVYDVEGKRYMDMLSAYSSVNQGHRHPKIIEALKKQADKITIASRAFYTENLGVFYEKLSTLTKKTTILAMNSGAEAVETAIKAARRWGYQVKGVRDGEAEIIVCSGNFHGRTTTAISFSSDEDYKRGFGPFTPGFKIIPYGDMDALKEVVTRKTVAFLVEPIQGEAGIIIPPNGFLREAYEFCKSKNVLFMADEIQTGFGRSGKMFACDWENVVPDVYILGKALGGGVLPISAVCANREILGVFGPGSHGSTFGGNPLACAVAIAALDVIVEDNLPVRSKSFGEYLLDELLTIEHPSIKEIRGRGLFIGIELHEKARPYCEKLKELGLLCKETHENTIRLAPPLIITKKELDWAIGKIKEVFEEKKEEKA